MMRAFLVGMGLFGMAIALDLNYFNATYERTLTKDQFLVLDVYDREYKRTLAFRWTLFHNEGLVTHTNYDGHPHQHILYTRMGADTIKIALALRDEEKALAAPYLLITFLGYDYVSKSARFMIYHKDASTQTQIDLKE